ncbi:MAG: 16S rRNA (adenine(1518)-N(6)/adenine(1519)-N(6))-dimethyltransferase RsmA, partial [Halobacteria archaeon]|nr:16S rRNA (adenine(1518)-N(6)/adenine(1519)-N(6))-dimethyltransferase RsmA [Halobacteria archaeon]
RHVLEIGGGVGNLTSRLVERFAKVTVIEKDPELAGFLRSEFPGAKVIEGDALEVKYPDFDICVSNLPYSVSSPLIYRLVLYRNECVLMVQREFAERMVAEPGTNDYGRMSVTSRYHADVEILEEVPRTAFEPQPEVESAVVRLTPRKPHYRVEDEEFFMDFLRGVFTQRRKTLRNAIRNTTHITGIENPEEALKRIPEKYLRKRPGKISPGEFAEIVNEIKKIENDRG